MKNLQWVSPSAMAIKTPFYIYNKKQIIDNVNRLKGCFREGYYKILYAMKANSNVAIIKLITRSGLGIDACSEEEVRLSFLCGINKQDIYYNADCLTADEIDFAIRTRVNLVIGSLDALKYVAHKYSGIAIALRINTGVGAGHSKKVVTNGEHSKFGFHLSELQDVRFLCGAASLTILGLHTHMGSGEMDVSGYTENARILTEISAQFPSLKFLNFGGGFGFDYKGDKEYNINEVHACLNQIRSEFNIPDKLHFIIEPGRYIVANSGVLVSKVSSVKYHPTRNFIGLDTGYNHFARCFYYGAWHDILNLTGSEDTLETYDIVGNLCQSGDVFAKDRVMPKCRAGDLLCIMDVGAYGFSMSSGFNSRVKPGEYLVEDDGSVRMIRRPEKFEDIVSTFILD